MNLAEIRTAMFAQADWAPNQSKEAVGRVNGFINRAYNQLSLEAPYLFFEDKLRVATEPDVKSASDSDKLKMVVNTGLPSNSEDPWTWRTNYTKTTADADTDGLYTTTWKTDRSWDGRVIEFELADGTLIRNQIRTMWLESDRWYITTVHPFNKDEHGAAGVKWRIYTEAYAFPDDIIAMRSMRLFNNTQQYPLDVLGQDEAEQRTLVGPRAQVAAGIPRLAFRREHFQLDGPGLAPEVSNATAVTAGDPVTLTYPWMGPEKFGEFEYVVTYTWGKRDAEFRLPGLPKWDSYASRWNNTDQTISRAPNAAVADNRVREPRYESAPSPVSAKKSVEYHAETSSCMAIHVTVPNIEYVLGFISTFERALSTGETGTRVSEHQSGFHVRIYRRRVRTLEPSDIDPAASSYGGLTHAVAGLKGRYPFPDNKQKFYLLAEMRVDELNKGRFVDDGQYIPDRSRPLRDVHGYQQYALYPHPDKRYEIDVRCVRRPQELKDERDVPVIHAEAIDALILKAMGHLYESMGNLEASQLMLGRYAHLLTTLNKRYGDLRPAAVPVLRRMSRARYGQRSRDGYRKWYKTET